MPIPTETEYLAALAHVAQCEACQLWLETAKAVATHG